ncbi:hypothetical protein A3A95_03015 [Candidatus Nomurabacteria bacterium RIFCSPLOWO2_01_FULL_39_18]|uniref:Uncharacterized protein n=1 Tax=Candidatus Nomurabacteria bacterium RIFCSPHIGHO2_01_FULL_40_24b TaxID=1801739 RepID=A0A1F6V7R5_9BACT|nr:MAG: hypothetical protein A2647_03550 [Candidatus Nomurabacteria bacterium RIFCSPHIGHO2_01_FULL_40_24b]OGI89629.1 MAG: hypothetical protein A3A95_03015 [Candidatus Nomurabacteria bacterium RIFCSPLOWO2_01_FULL_39_18]
MKRFYGEHKGKVIETDSQFKHVMAITLNPRTNYKDGVARCITSRSGDLALKGNIDRSELHKITGSSLEHYKIGERLNIKNEKEIIDKLVGNDGDFIGLEDPDIWIEEKTNLIHLYFTIPIRTVDKDLNRIGKTRVHLGHTVGPDLDSLEMTKPVLMDNGKFRAKEVSIAPINKRGFRFNLIESKDRRVETSYSIVQVAIAKDMGGSWEYGDIAFHPAENNLPWIGGHASPGPLFSKNFIDVGAGKLLGVINGCKADKIVGGETTYGTFSIGLFIYDYENGKINWVSPEPFIEDSEAGKGGGRAITFASQFVETGQGEGILYTHVDDSFVRAYTLKAQDIKSLLPSP